MKEIKVCHQTAAAAYSRVRYFHNLSHRNHSSLTGLTAFRYVFLSAYELVARAILAVGCVVKPEDVELAEYMGGSTYRAFLTEPEVERWIMGFAQGMNLVGALMVVHRRATGRMDFHVLTLPHDREGRSLFTQPMKLRAEEVASRLTEDLNLQRLQEGRLVIGNVRPGSRRRKRVYYLKAPAAAVPLPIEPARVEPEGSAAPGTAPRVVETPAPAPTVLPKAPELPEEAPVPPAAIVPADQPAVGETVPVAPAALPAPATDPLPVQVNPVPVVTAPADRERSPGLGQAPVEKPAKANGPAPAAPTALPRAAVPAAAPAREAALLDHSHVPAKTTPASRPATGPRTAVGAGAGSKVAKLPPAAPALVRTQDRKPSAGAAGSSSADDEEEKRKRREEKEAEFRRQQRAFEAEVLALYRWLSGLPDKDEKPKAYWLKLAQQLPTPVAEPGGDGGFLGFFATVILPALVARIRKIPPGVSFCSAAALAKLEECVAVAKRGADFYRDPSRESPAPDAPRGPDRRREGLDRS